MLLLTTYGFLTVIVIVINYIKFSSARLQPAMIPSISYSVHLFPIKRLGVRIKPNKKFIYLDFVDFFIIFFFFVNNLYLLCDRRINAYTESTNSQRRMFKI